MSNGLKAISSDAHGQKYKWVPFEIIEKDIKIKKRCSSSPIV